MDSLINQRIVKLTPEHKRERTPSNCLKDTIPDLDKMVKLVDPITSTLVSTL